MTDSNPGQDPWAGTWKDKAYFADLCCYATQDAIKMFLPICCKTLFFLLFTSVHHPFFSLVMRHILNPQATLLWNLVLSKRYKGFGATGIILSISISPVPMPHSETQTCSKTPRSKQVQMDPNSHHLKDLNQGFPFDILDLFFLPIFAPCCFQSHQCLRKASGEVVGNDDTVRCCRFQHRNHGWFDGRWWMRTINTIIKVKTSHSFQVLQIQRKYRRAEHHAEHAWDVVKPAACSSKMLWFIDFIVISDLIWLKSFASCTVVPSRCPFDSSIFGSLSSNWRLRFSLLSLL